MYEIEFPVQFHTVDIACIKVNYKTGNYDILLGKKPQNDQWILPGGFVDVGESAEEAASRELFEETKISLFIKPEYYLGSFVISDKRYEGTPHGITTSLFCIDVDFNVTPLASDDLEDCKFFNLFNLNIEKAIRPNHRQLLYAIKLHYAILKAKNGR